MNYKDAKDPTGQQGLEYQDWVADLYREHHRIIIQNYSSRKYQFEHGENPQGYEIKLDKRCTDTGRLSIEMAEKSQASQVTWTPSGIYSTPGSVYYVQGNYNIVFEFSTKLLRNLFETGRYETKEDLTIKTFYLPFDVASLMGEVRYGNPATWVRSRSNNGGAPKTFEQLLLPILSTHR